MGNFLDKTVFILLSLGLVTACDTDEFDEFDESEEVDAEQDARAESEELINQVVLDQGQQDLDANNDDLAADLHGETRSSKCSTTFSVCFFHATEYAGKPTAIRPGDFDVKFTTPVVSFIKNAGSAKMAIYLKGGGCKVLASGAQSEKYQYPVVRARRLEGTQGC